MTYISIRDDIKAALGVGDANDAILLSGVKRAGRYLLRNFNFPQSLIYFQTDALAADADEIDLDSGTGKILGVRLKFDDGSGESETNPLYSVMRRREPSVLPVLGGPSLFWRTDQTLKFDRGVPDESSYYVEIWYQSVDLTVTESWLTCDYEDVMFNLGAKYCCPLVHKPELLPMYDSLWQESQAMLAVYLNELEWENYSLRMGNDEPLVVAERYPSSAV